MKMPERDAAERSRNFEEVNLGYTLADALVEAERCIQCARPTCIAGCPVSIDIPRFIRHLLVRDLPGALSVIQETNLFPSVCGRVCPQETQCEIQCILEKKMEPVAIGRLERFVGDHAPLPDVQPPANAGQLGQGGRRRLRPGRPRLRGRPRPQGGRRDGLRGAPRRRGRPEVRHPVVPPPADDDRPRGERARRSSA